MIWGYPYFWKHPYMKYAYVICLAVSNWSDVSVVSSVVLCSRWHHDLCDAPTSSVDMNDQFPPREKTNKQRNEEASSFFFNAFCICIQSLKHVITSVAKHIYLFTHIYTYIYMYLFMALDRKRTSSFQFFVRLILGCKITQEYT